MAKESCEICYFGGLWQESGRQMASCICRRFPLVQPGDRQSPDVCPFPVTRPNDWCGEFKKAD